MHTHSGLRIWGQPMPVGDFIGETKAITHHVGDGCEPGHPEVDEEVDWDEGNGTPMPKEDPRMWSTEQAQLWLAEQGLVDAWREPCGWTNPSGHWSRDECGEKGCPGWLPSISWRGLVDGMIKMGWDYSCEIVPPPGGEFHDFIRVIGDKGLGGGHPDPFIAAVLALQARAEAPGSPQE